MVSVSEQIEKLKQYLLDIEANDYYIFDRESYACLATIWKHISEIEKEIVARGEDGKEA